jgi:two-component system OmpR family sensor kinase
LAFALVMAIVLAATGTFIRERLASNLDQATNRALRARAADVAALAQQSDTGLIDSRAAGPSGQRVEIAQLITAGGRVIDHTPTVSSRPLINAAALRATSDGRQLMRDLRLVNDQPVRLLAESVRAQGQTMTVVVGLSLEDRNRALSDLTGVLALGGPAALVLASIAGFLLTGGALRPVEAMRRRAAAISATNLADRLAPAGGNDEFGRLERTLNEMLARIQTSVVRERTFVSDASHELRSPLAVLRTELELIARDRPSGPALQSAIGSAIEETDRLRHIADDLLTLARADDQQLTIQAATVSAVRLLREAAGRAPSSEVSVTVNGGDSVRVHADPGRIGQAIDNLLANAIRHARSRVELSVVEQTTAIELHVTDDGAGFPADFLPHAWERFSRADAGRTEEGAGLGLSIVQTIAELHGGHAQAGNRPAGGADVWITLPRYTTIATATQARHQGADGATYAV